MNFFALFLLFALHSTLAQDQWRLVYEDGMIEVASGEPRLTPEQRKGLQYAWSWSGLRAPRRFEAAALGKKLPNDSSWLAIQVSRSLRSRPPSDLRVIAAPLDMWRDLPEASLPSWPVPANGRLSIPFGTSQRWRLRVAGQGEGTWWADVAPGQKAVLLTPIAAQGVEMQVIGPDRRPASPATVIVSEGRARQGPGRFWATLRASGDGRFELPGLPDAEGVTVSAYHPTYAPAFVQGRLPYLPRQLTLATGVTLSGRLLAPSGAPIARARIEVETWAESGSRNRTTFGGTSDENGAWAVPGLPAGEAVVRAEAKGFATLQEQIEIAADGTDLGDRTLQPGQQLAVLVVDERGEPVLGAEVKAGAGPAVPTDSRGAVTLSGLPPAPLQIDATARRHQAGKVRLNPPFPQQVRVRLSRAFTVLGRLVDEGGSPVPAGLVRVDQPTCFTYERLADDGRFELDLQPEQAVTLTFRSPATRELRLLPPPGAPGEVQDLGDVKAPHGAVVTGRVVGSRDGSPVPGARVWLPRPGADAPVIAWAGRDLLEAVTDVEGRFELSGLPPGPVLVRVEAAGFSRAHLEALLASDQPGLDLGEVRLSEGATLRVLARDLEGGSETPEEALARADLRGLWLDLDMLTSPVRDGEAVFRNVPPGPLTVSVLAGRKLLCEREVTVGEGEELAVDCRKGVVRVSGTVLVGGAATGPGMLLWRPAGSGAQPSLIDNLVTPGGLRQQEVFGMGRPPVDVAVAPDGRFLTADLSPGRWRVSWQPSAGSSSGEREIEIPRAEQSEVEISFPGLAVAGKVHDEEGRPVEGARVRDLASGALAFSGPDGSFQLASLEAEAGQLQIQAQHEGRSSRIVEIAVLPDRVPEPVVLTLGEGSRSEVEVRVVAADGSPVSGAFVFLEEAGRGQRILTTDTGGRALAALNPPLAPQVRAAAIWGESWGFGDWTDQEQARSGLVVQLAPTGSLRISSQESEGVPGIVSRQGWDLTRLLTQLGAPPRLSPGQVLQMPGLPAGLYTVSLAGAAQTVAVREGEQVPVQLD